MVQKNPKKSSRSKTTKKRVSHRQPMTKRSNKRSTSRRRRTSRRTSRRTRKSRVYRAAMFPPKVIANIQGTSKQTTPGSNPGSNPPSGETSQKRATLEAPFDEILRYFERFQNDRDIGYVLADHNRIPFSTGKDGTGLVLQNILRSMVNDLHKGPPIDRDNIKFFLKVLRRCVELWKTYISKKLNPFAVVEFDDSDLPEEKTVENALNSLKESIEDLPTDYFSGGL